MCLEHMMHFGWLTQEGVVSLAEERGVHHRLFPENRLRGVVISQQFGVASPLDRHFHLVPGAFR